MMQKSFDGAHYLEQRHPEAIVRFTRSFRRRLTGTKQFAEVEGESKDRLGDTLFLGGARWCARATALWRQREFMTIA
jgi:hypothetical protein